MLTILISCWYRAAFIICSIFITLIVIGATQTRLQFNVTQIEVGQEGTSPLLRLSFPIQGVYEFKFY
jgi:hypothetical protein